MIVLVTGSAGFIGYHLVEKLLQEEISVIGLDNINNYYDINLKKARLNNLNSIKKNHSASYTFYKGNLENQEILRHLFSDHKITHVINLAAQAGVRYSIENPSAYIQSNIVGFSNLIEECKNHCVKHLIYASSSSVYGGNKITPFSEDQNVDHPISIYAASKRANELIAHTYSHLYSLPTTGLRLFTVYGPWGRPDMALFLFTKSIMENKQIKIFNHGKMARAFTYIDDIIESIFRLIRKPGTNSEFYNSQKPNPGLSWCPFKIFNIGSSSTYALTEYIEVLESCLGKKAKKIYLEMQPGDVKETNADSSLLERYIGYKPQTSIQDGIKKFVDWYKDFYHV